MQKQVPDPMATFQTTLNDARERKDRQVYNAVLARMINWAFPEPRGEKRDPVEVMREVLVAHAARAAAFEWRFKQAKEAEHV